MIMFTAEIAGGESRIPNHPANPNAATFDSKITANAHNGAAIDLNKIPRDNKMKPNISGTSETKSLSAASANSWLIITIPVKCTTMPGCAAIASAASFRAKFATSGCSTNGFSPGKWIGMLIPVTLPSAEINRFNSSGSSIAIFRILSSSSSGISFGSSATRSSTIRSSPSAYECWKLVIESTRRECGISQPFSVNSRTADKISRSKIDAPGSFGVTTINTFADFEYVCSIASNACRSGFSGLKKTRMSFEKFNRDAPYPDPNTKTRLNKIESHG